MPIHTRSVGAAAAAALGATGVNAFKDSRPLSLQSERETEGEGGGGGGREGVGGKTKEGMRKGRRR